MISHPVQKTNVLNFLTNTYSEFYVTIIFPKSMKGSYIKVDLALQYRLNYRLHTVKCELFISHILLQCQCCRRLWSKFSRHSMTQNVKKKKSL